MSKFPIVTKLKNLVSADHLLKEALLSSILKAKLHFIKSLNDYYCYLDDLCAWIPLVHDKQELYNKVVTFFWLLECDSDVLLRKNNALRCWILDFFEVWGEYLDTKESLLSIDNITNDVGLKVKHQTQRYNGNSVSSFITHKRNIKIHKKYGDDVVLFPNDGIFGGVRKIEKCSLSLSNISVNIELLLSNSAYNNQFIGGKFVHISLNCKDSQYYIAPVNGVVLEVCKIPSIVPLGVKYHPSGYVEFCKGKQFQCIQDRGIIVLNNEFIGLVAIVPIGLLQIGHVDFKVVVGNYVSKGSILGEFRYGGSDSIVFFANHNLEFCKRSRRCYKLGEKMASLIET
jgi:phosphatidylserine decarboxylase